MALGTKFFLSVVLTIGVASSSDPSYDHQTATYDATFSPIVEFGSQVSITPFFAPEHSTDTLVSLIEEAKSSIDIYTPSASSWTSECGAYADDDSATCAPGCTPSEQRNETFPLFQALLNALHNGVSVRLITNDYGLPDCDGTITMLQFLALNGAQVRYFTTTTYVHAKFTSIDNGTKSAVSSINWSKTSMTKNREAGGVIESLNTEGKELNGFMQSVFEYDFDQAYNLSTSDTWSAEDLAVITDSSPVTVTLPTIDLVDGMYITPSPQAQNSSDSVIVQASPDSAWETISNSIMNATSTLEIAMYQVTTDDLCDDIISLYSKGINISLMVSSRIYDESDCEDAQACYAKLYDAGLRFRKSSLYYSYSHNKYWIVDGKTVAWSTGNWSPSDYPTDHDNVYPPYGDSNWWKTNRDFTVYTENPGVVSQFQTVMWNDWYAPSAYDWQPEYNVYCGY